MTIAFKKFVIINPSELERLKEKRIREYDQNVTALARLETNIESLLADESISVEEKLKLYYLLSAKFENVQAKCNISTLQPSRAATAPVVLAPNINVEPPIQATLPVQEEIQPQVQPEVLQLLPIKEDAGVMPQVPNELDSDNMTLNLPTQFHSKFKSLMAIVKNFPGEISRSNNNELIISGKVLPDTSFTDLIRNLYVQSSSLNNIG